MKVSPPQNARFNNKFFKFFFFRGFLMADEGDTDIPSSGFIPEVLIVEQHSDESDDDSNTEEEDEFSEIPPSSELAENVSESEMYDDLDIALNQPRRPPRPQQNPYQGRPGTSTCCLLI